MKKQVCACLMMFVLLTAQARDVKYPVSAIAPALLKNVNAVVREDETATRIFSRSSTTTHYHFVVTIMNANAKRYAYVYVGYDKNSKVKDLKAVAYDANGEVIKKAKTSDIIDRASFDGFSLFSDNRIKIIDLSQATYPYTIEYEYDIEYNYLYSIGGSSLAGKQTSVEHFTYQLTYPTSLKPRYKAYNIDKAPVVSSPGAGIESLTWTLENVTPLEVEPMSPDLAYVRRIEAAPSDFEYSGYVGNMSTWEAYGKWLWDVNKDRDKLPDAARQKVKELTKGLKTDEEKAKAIYEYMQGRTRYVSIQLGIGGLQTFEASTVDQTGYGDCKALSNYMVAMLKEAGIKAYYAAVEAGEDATEVDTSFPSHQSNHMIVAIPNERDTLWLECTSQTTPFGFIGKFTDDRYALLITDRGGKLVRTTKYTNDMNVRSTNAVVTLDASGNATAKVGSDYSGLEYDNVGALNSSTQQQKEWIQQSTDIPNFNVNQFTITNKKGKIPTATVQMELTLSKYASVSNKRLFVTPNLMNRSSFVPEKVEKRKSPFVLNANFTHVDTITFVIPENIYPEFLPPQSRFTSRFGTYESGFQLDQGKLVYYRRMTRVNGQFPAEAYQELIDFYKNVNKADNTKLVFLSKT